MTDYLEEGAAILRDALETAVARYNAIVSFRKADDRRELMEARVRVAEGFAALGAAEREAPPGAVLPHELELRIADALSMAARYPVTDGGHHKTWIVDQVVRRLTGCLDGGAETAEYLRFREEEDDWDEGIAP